MEEIRLNEWGARMAITSFLELNNKNVNFAFENSNVKCDRKREKGNERQLKTYLTYACEAFHILNWIDGHFFALIWTWLPSSRYFWKWKRKRKINKNRYSNHRQIVRIFNQQFQILYFSMKIFRLFCLCCLRSSCNVQRITNKLKRNKRERTTYGIINFLFFSPFFFLTWTDTSCTLNAFKRNRNESIRFVAVCMLISNGSLLSLFTEHARIAHGNPGYCPEVQNFRVNCNFSFEIPGNSAVDKADAQSSILPVTRTRKMCICIKKPNKNQTKITKIMWVLSAWMLWLLFVLVFFDWIVRRVLCVLLFLLFCYYRSFPYVCARV